MASEYITPFSLIPYLEVLVDLAAALAWPAALVVLGWLFRDDLKPLLAHVQHFGPSGVNFFRQGQSVESPSQEAEKIEFSTEALEDLSDPAAVAVENGILEEISRIAKEDREGKLIRALTFRVVEKIFSLVYAEIYGSQIAALEELNERNISFSEAEKMFSGLKSADSYFEGVELNQYLRFLFQSNFIEVRSGSYAITATGRNFLGFLASHGLSKKRPH